MANYILYPKNKTSTQTQSHLLLSNVLVPVQAYGQTGAVDGNCALSIVPVQVKHNKGQKVIQTYDFGDSGSSATFC